MFPPPYFTWAMTDPCNSLKKTLREPLALPHLRDRLWRWQVLVSDWLDRPPAACVAIVFGLTQHRRFIIRSVFLGCHGGCLGGWENAVIPLIFYIHPTATPRPSSSHAQCISSVLPAHDWQARSFVFRPFSFTAKVLTGGGWTCVLHIFPSTVNPAS